MESLTLNQPNWKATLPSKWETIIAMIALFSLGLPIIVGSAPNIDELAHLASGLYHWQTGRFDSYLVNPPLVRMICTAPLLLSDELPEFKTRISGTVSRYEWELDDQLLEWAGAEQAQALLVQARCVNLLLATIGCLYCFRWASWMHGKAAGRVAATMWITCPNILTWSCTINPDVGATAFGLVALFHFSRAMQSCGRAKDHSAQHVISGVATGLAILAKTTWLLLAPCFIVSFVFYRLRDREKRGPQQLVVIASISLITIHVAFGLGQSLPNDAAPIRESTAEDSLDRYLLQLLPTPIRIGIQVQQRDFQLGKRSHLRGQWSSRGWKRYYLECLLWKTPLPWLLLIALGLAHLGCRRRLASQVSGRTVIAVSLFVFGVVISSLSGISRHFRYIIPCIPLLYVVGAGTRQRYPRLTVALLVLGMLSSLTAWPLCHSYFSILTGGSRNGHAYLSHSSLDWGEDLFLIEEWAKSRSQHRPLFYDVANRPFAECILRRAGSPADVYTRAGWYIIRLESVSDPAHPAHRFRNSDPVERIGDAHAVYRVPSSKPR